MEEIFITFLNNIYKYRKIIVLCIKREKYLENTEVEYPEFFFLKLKIENIKVALYEK